MYILQQCYINISPYHHIKIDEDDGFPPPHPHRLVNLIRVWPGWFFSGAGLVWTLAAAAAWCPDLRIRPTGPHFVRERSAVENRLQKRPKKEKKGRMQKMSQIPESLTGGWKEVPLCIQLAKSGNQGGIVDIARMLR